MNIIDINYEKLGKSIDEYIISNNELFACPYVHITYDKPIILMSNDTFNFLKEKGYYIREEKNYPILTIHDCYIAIANWLSFGEVLLK